MQQNGIVPFRFLFLGPHQQPPRIDQQVVEIQRADLPFSLPVLFAHQGGQLHHPQRLLGAGQGRGGVELELIGEPVHEVPQFLGGSLELLVDRLALPVLLVDVFDHGRFTDRREVVSQGLRRRAGGGAGRARRLRHEPRQLLGKHGEAVLHGGVARRARLGNFQQHRGRARPADFAE